MFFPKEFQRAAGAEEEKGEKKEENIQGPREKKGRAKIHFRHNSHATIHTASLYALVRLPNHTAFLHTLGSTTLPLPGCSISVIEDLIIGRIGPLKQG